MSMFESLNLRKDKKPMREAVPNASPEALDMIQKLLLFRPASRLNAEDALRHPYVERFHTDGVEPSCDKDLNIPLDDNRKFEVRKYREEMYKYIEKRNRELRRQRRI